MTDPRIGVQAAAQTATARRDAVKQAFNKEYQATMQAMSNAAEKARKQILDQRLVPSRPTQTGKAPDIDTLKNNNSDAPAMVMVQIAAEIRRMVLQEVDKRMVILTAQVEEAITHACAINAGETGDATQKPDENIAKSKDTKTEDDTTDKPGTA
ncbi:MAG: hypothetical protein ABID63_08115 [Pseudomonadota bacterium]